MPDFPAITQRYGPAVVHIGVTGTASPDEDGQASSKSVADNSDKSVALLVQRGDDKIFVPIRLG